MVREIGSGQLQMIPKKELELKWKGREQGRGWIGEVQMGLDRAGIQMGQSHREGEEGVKDRRRSKCGGREKREWEREMEESVRQRWAWEGGQ